MKYQITMKDGAAYTFDEGYWLMSYLESHMGDEESGAINCGPDVLVSISEIAHVKVERENAA